MHKEGKCKGNFIAKVLVIIGALNWGLVGILNWNLVEALLGSISWLERLVYILVGLAGLVIIFGCCCKKCREEKCGSGKGSCCGGSGEKKD